MSHSIISAGENGVKCIDNEKGISKLLLLIRVPRCIRNFVKQSLFLDELKYYVDFLTDISTDLFIGATSCDFVHTHYASAFNSITKMSLIYYEWCDFVYFIMCYIFFIDDVDPC